MLMLMLWLAGPKLGALTLEDIDVVKEYQKDGTEVIFMCRCGKVVINDVRTDVPCKKAADGYTKVTGREVRAMDGEDKGAVQWPMGISSGERTEVVCDNLPEEKKLAEVYTKEMNENASIFDPNAVDDSEEEEVDELTSMNNDMFKIDSDLVDTKEKDGVVSNYYENGTLEVINPDKTWTQYYCEPPASGDQSSTFVDFVDSDSNGNAERQSRFAFRFDRYMYNLGSDLRDEEGLDTGKYMKLVGFTCDSADDSRKFKQMFDENAVAIAEKDVYESPFYIIPKYNLEKKDLNHEYYLKVPSKHKGDMKDFYFEDDKKKYKEIQTTDNNSEAYLCDNGVPKNIIKEDSRISDQSFTRTIAKQLKADSTLEKDTTEKIVEDYLKAVGFRCEDADQAELLINTYEDYEFPSYEKGIKGRSNLRKQVDAAYEEYGMKPLANSPQDNVNFIDSIADWFGNIFA